MREGRKKEVEEIGNWSVPDDLSKSRERLISYIVGARLESAKSLYVRAHAVRRSRVRVWGDSPRSASRNSICGERFARRVTETRWTSTSSWLNSVFSYHLAEAVARPRRRFVSRSLQGGNRVRYIKSDNNYCDRRGLILATCPSNVSRSRNPVSLSSALCFSTPRVASARATRYIGLIQMQPAPSCTFRSSSTKYRRLCCCAKKKAANLSTFLSRTIHLFKLTPSSFLANISASLFLSHVSYHFFGIRSVSHGPEL